MANRLVRFFKNRKKLGFTAGSVSLALLLALNLSSAIVPVMVKADGREVHIPQMSVTGERLLAVQANFSMATNVEGYIDYLSLPVRDVNGEAYAVIEPSGCSEFHGNVKVRFDFYLTPEAPRYYDRYLYLVDWDSPEAQAGYTGKIDEKTGEPLNWDDYNYWLDNLPHVWQNTPFHSHFCYFEPNVTDEEIKVAADFHLANFYDAWSQEMDKVPGGMRLGWAEETRIRPVRHEALTSRKTLVEQRVEEIKSLDISKSAEIGLVERIKEWLSPSQALARTIDSVKFNQEASFTYPVVTSVNGGNNTSNSTNHTVNLDLGDAGDMLLVYFCADGTTVITFPVGWIQLFQTSNGSVTFGAWYKIADGGESSTITVTTNQSQMSAHTSYRLTSAHAFTITAGTPATGTSDSPNPPSLSGVQRDYIWFSCCGYDKGTITVDGYPTDYTNGRNDRAGNANGCGVGTAYRALAASSEDPDTFTLSASDEWVANTICISNAEIDVGSGTGLGGGSWTFTYITVVEKTNPANDTGVIDTVDIEPYGTSTDWVNVEVASFYVVSGNNLSTRDYDSIGTVDGDGGAQQFTGLDFDINSGDYIGIYAQDITEDNNGEVRTPTGYSGIWKTATDNIPCTDVTFTSYDNYAANIYGTGETAPTCTEDISNSPVTWEVNSGNPVAVSSNYSTGLDYFTITNNSGGAVDITIQGTDMTGGTQETLRPNAAGDECNIRNEVGSACPNHYLNVDEVTPEWSSRVVEWNSPYTTWYRDLYNIANHSVGSGTINRITVYAVHACDTDTPDQTSVKIAIKSGTGAGAPDTVSESEEFTTTVGDLQWSYWIWVNNPATGSAWTWDEIDALQAGVALRSNLIAGGDTTSCTTVYVEVNYGGTAWELSEDASVGSMIYGLKAGLYGGDYTITVPEDSSSTLKSGLADSATQDWGLKLYTPTIYTDGYPKAGLVTVTATCQ